jgi:hypothetical protein
VTDSLHAPWNFGQIGRSFIRIAALRGALPLVRRLQRTVMMLPSRDRWVLLPFVAVPMLGGCLASDEPPVIPGTLEPPCALEEQHFRIDAIELPQSGTEASQLGFDLDGDEVVGNGGGFGLTIMTGYETETSTAMQELQAGLAAKLSDGRLDWVLRVATCAGGTDDHLRVSSFEAIDRDLDGVFELLEPAGAIPAVGAGGRADTGFGPMPVSALVDFLDTADIVEWSPGAAIAVAFTTDGDTLAGRIGAGVGRDGQLAIVRSLAEFFDVQLQAGISTYARDKLDTNRDGRISPDEVENDLGLSSFVSFDVDLFDERGDDPVFAPDRDRLDDQLSFGIGIRAGRVEIE